MSLPGGVCLRGVGLCQGDHPYGKEWVVCILLEGVTTVTPYFLLQFILDKICLTSLTHAKLKEKMEFPT